MRQLPWESVAGSGESGGGEGIGRRARREGSHFAPAAAWRLAQVAENQYGYEALIAPDSSGAAQCGNIGERRTRPRWMTEGREVGEEGVQGSGVVVRV